METPKHQNDEDGKIDVSHTNNQENAMQDNPSRPSEMSELRTPVQPVSVQNLDLDDTVVVNEDRTGEN